MDSCSATYRFRLAYRPPYDWDALLAFLSARATPGVEVVEQNAYRRTIALDGKQGDIRVTRAVTGHALNLEVRFPDPHALLTIVERVRRMFDLHADPAAIASLLGGDPQLRAVLRRHPGLRMPGAWDGFELAVRAIVGQQISVKGATTIAGRIAVMFGLTAEALQAAPLERAGLIAARANAIRELAKRVISGAVQFNPIGEPGAVIGALQSIPGIGAWTAQYVAMRALGEPDAFPSGDVVLQRMSGNLTARELDRRAEAWRPWRSYAVMLLWQSATDEHRHH